MEFTGERVVPGQVDDDLWAEHFSRYAFALRLISGGRVLDIGCGTGYGTAELAGQADMAVGLDVSAEAAGYAASHYGSSPKARFLAASAAALPFRDASFDVITVFEVIEHLADWRSLLSEVRRVLRPGGVVLISTPNKIYYGQTRSQSGANPFHVHEFEPSEFQQVLGEIFPHVALLLQNRVPAFAFYAPENSAPADAQIATATGAAEDAHFLLAVCAVEAPLDMRAFLYVPRASNVLRERELHIHSLQSELTVARSERDGMLQAHQQLTQDLQEKIRWALDLEQQVAAARGERDTVMQSNQVLMRDSIEKTQWAQGLDEEIARAHSTIEKAEQTVIERTLWAQDLDAQLQAARTRDGSLWVRIGQSLGLVPGNAPPKREKDG